MFYTVDRPGCVESCHERLNQIQTSSQWQMAGDGLSRHWQETCKGDRCSVCTVCKNDVVHHQNCAIGSLFHPT